MKYNHKEMVRLARFVIKFHDIGKIIKLLDYGTLVIYHKLGLIEKNRSFRKYMFFLDLRDELDFMKQTRGIL